MRNYKDVDVVECLKKIFYETNKKHETDFKFDIIIILNEAKKAKQEGAPRHLLWMARPTGTWCFPEGNVYIEGTPERKIWLGYIGNPCAITTFAIEITGVRDNTAVGNVYELVYAEHIKQVQRNHFTPVSVDVELKNGEHICMAIDKFNYYKTQFELESISSMSYIVEDDEEKYLDFLTDIRQLRYVSN